MKVHFDQIITDLEGEPLTREGKDKKDVVVTLGYVVSNALLGPAQGTEPAERKIALFDLAKLVHAGGEHELTSEQVVLCKEKVNVAWSALVVGQALRMLESGA